MRLSIPGFLLLGTLPLACATTQPPTEQLTDSKAAVRSAEEVGAQRVPQSALFLNYSKDQIARAEQLIRHGDDHRAALILQRAESDAELSIALAREAPMRQEATAALRRVQELKAQEAQPQTQQQPQQPSQQQPAPPQPAP